MLVAMTESEAYTHKALLAECHGYRNFSEMVAKLEEYDKTYRFYRVTVTRYGSYWYIHANDLGD